MLGLGEKLKVLYNEIFAMWMKNDVLCLGTKVLFIIIIAIATVIVIYRMNYFMLWHNKIKTKYTRFYVHYKLIIPTLTYISWYIKSAFQVPANKTFHPRKFSEAAHLWFKVKLEDLFEIFGVFGYGVLANFNYSSLRTKVKVVLFLSKNLIF